MWERFSYFGMRGLLVLYMVKYVLHPEVAEEVIGLSALRHGLEAIFGPLGIQPFASQIYQFYTGLVYLTPVIGGLMADRVLGHRRTVIIGALLIAIGHFMMAFEPLFLVALLFLILGSGAFQPNMWTQVGELYSVGDPRCDRAYLIFYVGINIGAFLAPLVCGTLGERVGWPWGFGAAGVGMLIGLAIYLAGTRYMPSDPPLISRARPQELRKPLDPDEWQVMLALVILFVPTCLFWATYEQQGNTLALWAYQHTDGTVNWLFLTAPFVIFALMPLVIGLWAVQAKRGTEPRKPDHAM